MGTIELDQVRIGLVGAGVIGQRHIGAIEQTDGVQLVAVADRDTTANDVADQLDVSFYTTCEQMLQNEQLDGVIIATPTEHHLSAALDALDGGAHVLIEKPICATVTEARTIVARSQERKRHVLVAHQRRYYSRVQRARNIVLGGELGRMVAVNGQWTLRKPDAYFDPDWRKIWKAGPVLTNLIHEIDTIRFICGEIDSISAETSNVINEWEKEDVAALVLRFRSGALGTFILSDQTPSPWTWEMGTGENISVPFVGENSLRFMGRQASLEFPNLALWSYDGKPVDWTGTLQSVAEESEAEDAYVLQMAHFRDVIRGDSAPRIDAADATRSLAATVAVLESAKSGARVVLD